MKVHPGAHRWRLVNIPQVLPVITTLRTINFWVNSAHRRCSLRPGHHPADYLHVSKKMHSNPPQFWRPQITSNQPTTMFVMILVCLRVPMQRKKYSRSVSVYIYIIEREITKNPWGKLFFVHRITERKTCSPFHFYFFSGPLSTSYVPVFSESFAGVSCFGCV